jgi:hypothetical protein
MAGRRVWSRNTPAHSSQLLTIEQQLATGVYNVVYTTATQRMSQVVMVK